MNTECGVYKKESKLCEMPRKEIFQNHSPRLNEYACQVDEYIYIAIASVCA